jgi:broad specificity phosphatase PhoE
MSSSPVKYLWIVRHGERYDHTDDQWRATAKRPHDPHLSQAGIKQSYAVGKLIHDLTRQQRHEEEMADIGIYTSPFLRCVQTAKAISTGYYDQLTGKAVSTATQNTGTHG